MVVYHTVKGERVFVLPDHLDHFHAREQDRAMNRGLTGREIVEMARLRVVIGLRCAYDWQTGEVRLTKRVAEQADAYAMICASHEVAHSKQSKWLVALAAVWIGSPAWLRWTLLLPLWVVWLHCETDAWIRAVGEE